MATPTASWVPMLCNFFLNEQVAALLHRPWIGVVGERADEPEVPVG